MEKYHMIPLFGIIALVCAGCGGSFPIAPAEGIVICDGKPVAFVQVNFDPKRTDPNDKSPLVGKGAIGFTDAEGKFVLTTRGTNDGAIIGRHDVIVSATSTTDRNSPATLSRHKAAQEIDVQKGRNVFTIDLPVRNPRTPLVIPTDD